MDFIINLGAAEMIETIVRVVNHVYPFQEKTLNGHIIKVHDVQAFNSLKELLEKKNQIQKKNKLVNSPYLINMVKIYQEELTLHYVYEHVPHSLLGYVKKCGRDNETNAKLILKRVSYELMMLISYLVNMKIDVDLSPHNLGFTFDGKLKIFMHARCKMGHKTEVSLLAYYNNCKEKILDGLQLLFEEGNSKEESPPNFVIKGNKLIFPQTPLNESICDSKNNESYRFEQDSFASSNYNSCESGIFNSTFFNNNSNNNMSSFKSSAASCINQATSQRPSFLRQTQSPKFGRAFNFSEAKHSSRSSRKPKMHKNSFQFGSNPYRNQRPQTEADDNSDAKSYTHSRSIKIQFQQRNDEKKKRKDSYKVKVTSFHQYELDDCDPQELFSKNPEGGDFFQFINKKAKQFQKKQQPQQESYEEEDSMTEPPAFMKKQSTPDYGYAATSVSSARNLEEKVKMAKEKATNLLSKYMKAKKMNSFAH